MSKKPKPIAMPSTSRDYEVQDAVHTLKRAEAIKSDPKLHAAAKAHARVEADHLRKVAGRAKK